MSLPTDHSARLDRARLALDGLSVGDAFGQQFFAELRVEIATRTPPTPPWHYTDDTEMALAIFEVLEGCGTIDQDRPGQAGQMTKDQVPMTNAAGSPHPACGHPPLRGEGVSVQYGT